MSAALNEALYYYVPAGGAADDSYAFCRGVLLSLVSASRSQPQTEAAEDGSGAGGASGSILFETSRTPYALTGIGLGLSMQPTDLKATASEALSKIRAQAQDGRNKCCGRGPMRSYGIAFSGRSCLVEGGLQG